MSKFVSVLSIAALSVVGAQAFAGGVNHAVRTPAATTTQSYYCGILQAYGQVDLKECGPQQVRKTSFLR